MSQSIQRSRFAILTSAILTCAIIGVYSAASETAGPSQGPDVIVGFVTNTQVFGREGSGEASRVGIAAATNSCNRGTAALNWYALPDARHPAITVNFYRLTEDRMEQLGQT